MTSDVSQKLAALASCGVNVPQMVLFRLITKKWLLRVEVYVCLANVLVLSDPTDQICGSSRLPEGSLAEASRFSKAQVSRYELDAKVLHSARDIS